MFSKIALSGFYLFTFQDKSISGQNENCILTRQYLYIQYYFCNALLEENQG